MFVNPILSGHSEWRLASVIDSNVWDLSVVLMPHDGMSGGVRGPVSAISQARPDHYFGRDDFY